MTKISLLSYSQVDSAAIQQLLKKIQDMEAALKKPKQGLTTIRSEWIRSQEKNELTAREWFNEEAVLALESGLNSLKQELVAVKKLIRPTIKALKKALVSS